MIRSTRTEKVISHGELAKLSKITATDTTHLAACRTLDAETYTAQLRMLGLARRENIFYLSRKPLPPPSTRYTPVIVFLFNDLFLYLSLSLSLSFLEVSWKINFCSGRSQSSLRGNGV